MNNGIQICDKFCKMTDPNVCTGPQHCENQEYNETKKDCQECLKDYDDAIKNLRA
jgi:hypothetical protein